MSAVSSGDAVLQRALDIFVAERDRLDAGIRALRERFNLDAVVESKVTMPLSVAPPRKRSKFTRAQRAEISQRMTRYWAKKRKAS